jgi:hypothetical protein
MTWPNRGEPVPVIVRKNLDITWRNDLLPKSHWTGQTLRDRVNRNVAI